jgi:uncharacterized membrane protein
MVIGAIAIFVAMFTGLVTAVLLLLVVSGERSRAAQEKARERRLAEARMNARLLRLNL